MAAPSLRIVRRPKGALVASATALTAASAPVDDPTQIFRSGLNGRRDDWQAEAWELYRLVGEYGWFVRFRARTCSRVRLIASEIDPDTGLPTGGISEDNAEGRRVSELVRTIAGGPLGQAELIKRTAQILGVPGELWIAVLVLPVGVKWFAVTPKQIERGNRNNTVVIKLPDGSKHEFNKANGDGMFRVWNEDAEDPSQPDSPVRSNLDPLREVVTASRKIRNADLSKLIGNGILVIPQEASLPDTNAPVSADKPGDPPTPPVQSGKVAQKLQNMIAAQAKIAVEEGPGSLASMTPLIVAAPAEHVDKIKHVTITDEITKVAIETRNAAIDRLAMGLDMTPEQLRGLGDTNHWSSRQLTDEDVNMYVKPVMETICHAIYDNAMRNVLISSGINPDKYLLWYDASDLTADPDKTDEAKDAHTAGALKNAALLRQLGLPDDDGYDLTSIEGLQELARDKVAQAEPSQFVQVIRDVLPLLDPSVQAIDFPQPPALPPVNNHGDDESDGDPQEEPDTEDTEPSAGAAVRGGDGLGMAIDVWVTRALELAGNRRVTTNDRALYARLRDVPKHEYHRYMDPAKESDVPRLIKGWDNGLDEFAARYGFDADEVRAVVRRQARRKLTTQVVDGQVG